MSSATVDESIFSGYLGLEMKENSGVFETKFFRLDPKACELQYYSEKENRQGTDAQPDGCFNISFMSMAADANSVRPKLNHGFYIVVSGRKHYFQADTDGVKSTWINKLLDASRITVQQRLSFVDQNAESGFRVEVVGGVVVKTPIEAERSDELAGEHIALPRPASPHRLEENLIKTGYCVKQGVFRKSWRRRFFILTATSLKYCRTVEDKTPLKIIEVRDIKEVQPLTGIQLNRENTFEVITPHRTFYLQASSISDRDSWISAISQCIRPFASSKDKLYLNPPFTTAKRNYNSKPMQTSLDNTASFTKTQPDIQLAHNVIHCDH